MEASRALWAQPAKERSDMHTTADAGMNDLCSFIVFFNDNNVSGKKLK